jgi:DNA polymerase III subunit epsilon
MQFIAFDLETTGVCPGVDQIVEIGAVRFNNGSPEAVFSTLIDPKRPIPPGASQVNGIFDNMLVGKPTIDQILPSFAEFCGDTIIVAHNAPFDVQFLTADIRKFEGPGPKGIILDTCNMARKVFPGLPNYKLSTLVQHLKIESTDFHRAEEDATYCGYLFAKMVEKISIGGVVPPIENLITLTGKPALLFPQIVAQPKQLGFML